MRKIKDIKIDYVYIAAGLVEGLIVNNELPYYNMIEGSDLGLEATTFKNGFTVSIGDEKTIELELNTLGDKLNTIVMVSNAIEYQYKALKDLNKKLDNLAVDFWVSVGFWVETGTLYVDLNLVVNDKNLAIALGLTNKQIAIYDNENNETIRL